MGRCQDDYLMGVNRKVESFAFFLFCVYFFFKVLLFFCLVKSSLLGTEREEEGKESLTTST